MTAADVPDVKGMSPGLEPGGVITGSRVERSIRPRIGLDQASSRKKAIADLVWRETDELQQKNEKLGADVPASHPATGAEKGSGGLGNRYEASLFCRSFPRSRVGTHHLRRSCVAFARRLPHGRHFDQPRRPRIVPRTRIAPVIRIIDVAALDGIVVNVVELLPHHVI